MQVYCWLNEGTDWYFKHVARLVLKQHNSCFVVSRNSYGSHGFRKWQCLKFSQLRDVKTLSAIPDSWRLKSSCYRVQKLGSDSITLTMIISHSRKILKYFFYCQDGGMWWKVGRPWIKCFPHWIGHETKQIGNSHEKLPVISKKRTDFFCISFENSQFTVILQTFLSGWGPLPSLPKRQITQNVSLWLSCTSNTMVPEIGSLTPWYLIDSIRANSC